MGEQKKMTVEFIKKMQIKYLEEHDETDSFIDAAAIDQILDICDTAIALFAENVRLKVQLSDCQGLLKWAWTMRGIEKPKED